MLREPAPESCMETLVPPDTFHLRAAEGWLGLGDIASASEELDQITPPMKAHPDVRLVRCEICHRAGKWDSLLAVAETLVNDFPENPRGWAHRSEALHELKRTQEAFDLLLPATATFPTNWQIRYQLARYRAQLGALQDSLAFLETACFLGDETDVRLLALGDRDLQPLWEIISQTSL